MENIRYGNDNTHAGSRSEKLIRVVILGAGYAGLNAAKRLSWEEGFHVTLVNPRDAFVERIRLHQKVAGNHSATVLLDQLLPSRTSFRKASAELIEQRSNLVHLSVGEPLPYDFVIYALGTGDSSLCDDWREGQSPSASLAMTPFGTWESAVELQHHLAGVDTREPVTVIGGGLTGVELAAELASKRKVRLVTAGELAPSVGKRARAYLRQGLHRLGVEISEGVRVINGTSTTIEYDDGSTQFSAINILTTRPSRPRLAADSGLPIDGHGGLLVDGTLTSLVSSSIIGTGDAATVQEVPIRGSCQAALPLGTHAAETVIARARGEIPSRIRLRFVSQNISLGRIDALCQRTDHHDSPTSLIVTGRPAAWIKEQVCTGTLRYVLNPRRGKWSSYSWSN